ncbi:paraquat-inducible protein A [Chryseolinea sp. T2]|uniref:paraquat-inducible protein A n=1 Tax=Chryseolinea sp. T2 TaxID=3129255 RepID=UPI00307862FF
MKPIQLLLCTCLFAVLGFLAYQLHHVENQRKQIKEDSVELSKIKYGLFSVDEWKRILATVISKKIEEFDFKDTNKDEMRKQISAFLYKQIAAFEQRFNRESSKSFMGLVRSGIASITGTFGELKNQVPQFTESIIQFMEDPRNRKAITSYVVDKLNDYTSKTFAEIDYTTYNAILKKYAFDDKDTAIRELTLRNAEIRDKSMILTIGLLAVALFIVALSCFARNIIVVPYSVAIAACAILLFTGLSLPMIEIDARIAEMSFSLLGEQVRFTDQVLYYKSKSILEVVSMMFTQGRFDLIFIGALVLLFSVLFPTAKLLSTMAYNYSEKIRTNKVIMFLVFKTGKWSMADVMVVAIFMSYIGFSGIITEQLRQIEGIALNIDILTTNRSSLQEGFYAFTGFSILSILISANIQNSLNVKES